MSLSTSIVIPNYNGLPLLKNHLPSVVTYADGAEIVVVDDASTDTSAHWVKTHYPKIKLIVNQKNLGFAGSVNRGFKHARGDLVLLLNNDVSINAGTIKHLLPLFSDPRVFAVGCLEKLPGGKTRGQSRGIFQRGMFIHRGVKQGSSGPTLWVFAASGMFRHSVWHQLNGLDELYKPAYYEDIDICYRAWKHGYRCLFQSSATVKHQAEATMNSALGIKKTAYVFKNQLLFIWKNITDTQFLLAHLLWLPYHLILTSYKTQGAFLKGFILALKQFPAALNSRHHQHATITDHQVFTASSASRT